jgi:diguanylate cyclase (GGDEF)-like protein
MLMIDIDHFKHINDQFGHSEGDRALFIVAATLKATCRQNDMAGRYGDEEFSVALPDTDVAGSRVAAENFRAAIAAIGELEFPLRASIRIVTFASEPNIPQLAMPELYAALIRNADAALYAAKNGGRYQVRHFDDLRRETLVARDISRLP